MNKNTIRAKLAALCRLALRGLNTIPSATPDIKALKSVTKNTIERLMRRVIVAPKEHLVEPLNCNFYDTYKTFERNEYGTYDSSAGDRVQEIVWLIYFIEIGLGYYDRNYYADVDTTGVHALRFALDEIDDDY